MLRNPIYYVLVSMVGLATTYSARPQEVTVDDVLRAWQRREAEARSFRFSCQKQEVVTAAYRAGPSGHNKTAPQRDTAPVPPAEKLTLDFTLAVDGDKYFYHEQGQVFAPSPPMAVGPKTDIRDRQVTVVAREGLVRVLRQPSKQPMPEGLPNPPFGEDLYTASPGLVIHAFAAGPLLLACRPISYYSSSPEDNQPTWDKSLRVSFDLGQPSAVAIEPKLCCLVINTGAKSVKSFVVVDPDKGLLPVRTIEEHSGQLASDLQIQYERRFDTWIPVQWSRVSRRSASQAMRFHETKVTSVVWNEPLPGSLFELEHPAGSWVNEYRGDKQRETYVVTQDTRKRYLASDEKDLARYEEILRPKYSAHWIIYVAVVSSVVLVVVGLWAAWRFKASSRS